MQAEDVRVEEMAAAEVGATQVERPQPEEPQTAASAGNDASVAVRVLNLAEEEHPSAHWAKRRAKAVAEYDRMRRDIEAHGWQRQVDWLAIWDDAYKILFSALVQEGRLTEDEWMARVNEYRLLYLRPAYQQLATTPPPGKRAPATAAAGVGVAGKGAHRDVLAERGALWRPSARHVRLVKPGEASGDPAADTATTTEG